MQKTNNYIILLIACLLCSVNSVFADYPIGKKRTAITGTFNYFYSSKYFNDQGKLISNNPGDYFQASSYSLNISHGLSRRVDMSVTIPFASQTLVNGNNSETKSGVTDINLGLSVHFPSVDYKNGFATVEFIYSRFLDAQDGPNQYRAVITMGKMYNKHTSVTASLSHQVSQSVNTAFNPNLQLNKNFNAATLNLSIGRKINRMITPTLQAYYTLLGKNAGLGMGANIFVTVRL